MGNVHVSRQNQQGEVMGEVLIQMIEDAAQQGVPLRFLVFENTKYPNSGDATLCVTFGNPPKQENARQDTQPQRGFRRNPGPPPPPFPESPQGEEFPDSVPDDGGDPDQTPEPEPIPRRRIPRR